MLCFGPQRNRGMSKSYNVFCLYFSAQTKSRLKWSILVHALMTLVMLAKLMPEILDRIDIFVLEVEELFLPKVRFGTTSFELSKSYFQEQRYERVIINDPVIFVVQASPSSE